MLDEVDNLRRLIREKQTMTLSDEQRLVLTAMYEHHGLTSERDAATFKPLGVGNGPGEVPGHHA